MTDIGPRNEHMQMTWQKGLDVLKPSPSDLEHGLALHRDALVIDNFGFSPKIWTQEIVDTINRWADEGMGAMEHSTRQTMLRIHGFSEDPAGREEFVQALDAAGVDGLVQTVGGGSSVDGVLKNMAAHRHLCHRFSDRYCQATDTDQIRDAREQGRTCIIWSVNGPPPFGEMDDLDTRLGWVDTWCHFGVRLMHLSYNRRNQVADGCTEDADGGLSEYGREFVCKLNQAGIIVDTPHTGRQSTLDAAAVSEKPLMASHIGCKGVFAEHPRCKSDEELKAIAGTDGLIGIYCLAGMLGPQATLNTMLDHVDYAARLIGVDHVAIGTDVCYIRMWPEDLRPHPARQNVSNRRGAWKPQHQKYSTTSHIDGDLAWTNWPLFTVGLVMRGYSDEDIRKILGENLVRVLDGNRPGG